MSYKDDVIESLKKSLKDVRSAGAILTLENLMVRRELGVPDHIRCVREDDSLITTIDELIAMIDVDKCSFIEITGSTDRYVGTYQGIRVVLENVYIFLQEENMLDRLIMANNFNWSLAKPAFTMEYRNDNDTDIPLKIAYTNLYSGKGGSNVRA